MGIFHEIMEITRTVLGLNLSQSYTFISKNGLHRHFYAEKFGDIDRNYYFCR